MIHNEHSLIWDLYLEGAAEDMIMSSLRKQQASPEEVSMFTRKENGKLLYRPDHVVTLLHWIRAQHADAATMVDDYKNYLKYFPTVKLDQFKSYIDWTERVHAKRDEATYQSRHRDTGSIDVQGEDQKNVLADDEDVLILRGDDEHKCVRYGKGYSFCISRPGGGNMYGTYRMSKESTFYFVFFKKIPKNDAHHIMVLDQTKEGLEWTFANNRTQPVPGGWNKVIATFPVLAKYKDVFINKPLTNEERAYQEQLRKFVASPSKVRFDQFTYQQQADVLKFGMLIPLDVFMGLDKFLRNEWVSVGPKMSDDVYKQLSPGERERFIKVREQQLTQRNIQDAYDVEICKNNPQLFKKHLRKDEKISQQEQQAINSRIKDGVHDGDITITSKYFFPDLETLKIVVGNINVETLSLSLPELQQCGHINANRASDLSLPQLRQSKNIICIAVKSLSLPQLQQCEFLNAASVGNLSLPQLQQCESIEASKALSMNLPKLQQSGRIIASAATSWIIPRFKQSEQGIFAPSAKQIVAPSAARPFIKNVPADCEIVEPDAQQLNDSMLQDLMKKYLLAK